MSVETLPPLARAPRGYDERDQNEARRAIEERLRAILVRTNVLEGYQLTGSVTWNPASITANDVATTTVTVDGAVVGDPVSVGFSALTTENALMTAHVQAADTVQVMLFNKTGVNLDLGSGTVKVVVWKH
jgi:hypothetical protein